MANSNSQNTIMIVLLTLLAVVAGYAFFNMQDNRSGAERLGDAVSELPEGPDKALDQLGDRSPAERVGDAIDDANDRAK